MTLPASHRSGRSAHSYLPAAATICPTSEGCRTRHAGQRAFWYPGALLFPDFPSPLDCKSRTHWKSTLGWPTKVHRSPAEVSRLDCRGVASGPAVWRRQVQGRGRRYEVIDYDHRDAISRVTVSVPTGMGEVASAAASVWSGSVKRWRISWMNREGWDREWGSSSRKRWS